jgi:hypothetical protein
VKIVYRVIPSTKAPAIERDLFMAELLAEPAKRAAALERGRDSHAGSIEALAEAVTVLQNRPSRAKTPKAKAPE